MTAKTQKTRFGYLAQPSTLTEEVQETSSVPENKTVKKQQFNVSISVDTKRQAMAKAALEGRNVSEVVEELLKAWIQT